VPPSDDRNAQRRDDAKRALRKVGDRIRRARAKLDETQDDRERAIHDADRAGMTRRAIADEVGVSYGRVEQILKNGTDEATEASDDT
jgi:transcriptional regulator with XRE-family HTH domain